VQLIRAARGDPALHLSPNRSSCGPNHSIKYGFAFSLLWLSACQAVQVKLTAAPTARMLDGEVISMRGLSDSKEKKKETKETKRHDLIDARIRYISQSARDQRFLLYLPTQMRFPIGGERVKCRGSKLTNSLG